MKKLILIAIVSASLPALSASAQGLFLFTGPVRGVWDVYSNGFPRLQGTMNVALMVNLNNGMAPAIDAIMTSTRTNGTASDFALFYALNQQVYWNVIMSDPNYVVAIDSATSQPAVAAVGNNGAWTYNSGASFGIAGSSGNGGTAQVYVLAWDKQFATPALAAANDAPLGWSAPFSYTYASGNPPGTPALMAPLVTPFGVYVQIPEPAVFTLAGLGAAAMLIFRRRK